MLLCSFISLGSEFWQDTHVFLNITYKDLSCSANTCLCLALVTCVIFRYPNLKDMENSTPVNWWSQTWSYVQNSIFKFPTEMTNLKQAWTYSKPTENYLSLVYASSNFSSSLAQAIRPYLMTYIYNCLSDHLKIPSGQDLKICWAWKAVRICFASSPVHLSQRNCNIFLFAVLDLWCLFFFLAVTSCCHCKNGS